MSGQEKAEGKMVAEMIDIIKKTELKRCPFCGGNVKMTVHGGPYEIMDYRAIIQHDCDTGALVFMSVHGVTEWEARENARKSWNNRR